MHFVFPLLLLAVGSDAADADKRTVSARWHFDYHAARQVARERNVPLFVVFR